MLSVKLHWQELLNRFRAKFFWPHSDFIQRTVEREQIILSWISSAQTFTQLSVCRQAIERFYVLPFSKQLAGEDPERVEPMSSWIRQGKQILLHYVNVRHGQLIDNLLCDEKEN